MSVRIIQGDAREVLATLPDASVHCCVTSNPYWGLRTYLPTDHPDKPREMGLEPTLDRHISELVSLFRQVKRVLRPEGTFWLNVGDCYATSANGRSAADTKAAGGDDRTFRDKPFDTARASGLRSGNLCLIPERFAIALQDDGWLVRSRIIWGKTNTKPDSSGRWRPSYNHEMIWLLSKQMPCFYDSVAVRRRSALSTDSRLQQNIEAQTGSYRQPGKTNGPLKAVGNVGDRLLRAYEPEIEPDQVWEMGTAAFADAHTATFPPELVERCLRAGTSAHGCCTRCGAPWARVTEKGEADLDHQRACGGDLVGDYRGIARKDYAAAGAQNASDVKRRVLEGMREIITAGWYPTCECDGLPELLPYPREPKADASADDKLVWRAACIRIREERARLVQRAAVIGVDRCTVLDPFSGAGTTALVADRLRQNAIGIDLNPEYVEMSLRRIRSDAGLLGDVA